jgi:hypothetical protein
MVTSLLKKINKRETKKYIKYDEKIHFLKYSACYVNDDIKDLFKGFLEEEINLAPYNYINLIKDLELQKNEKKNMKEKLVDICKNYILTENENQINISGLVYKELNSIYSNLEDENFEENLLNCLSKIKDMMYSELCIDTVKKNKLIKHSFQGLPDQNY